MMATRDPKGIMEACIASAKEAIQGLDIDVLEVIEV